MFALLSKVDSNHTTAPRQVEPRAKSTPRVKKPRGYLLLLCALLPTPAFAETSEQQPVVEQTVTPPELTTFVEAARPEGAPALEVAIEVLLELTVKADGSVADVTVLQGTDPSWDAAAVTAVQSFRFVPAKRGAEPLPVRIQYRYVFEPDVPPEPVATTPDAQAPSSAEAPKPRAAVPTGELAGQVLERGTRKPLVAARVALPSLGQETLTDAEGRFRFEQVPAGKLRLVIEDPEHQPVDDQEEVVANQLTEVSYYVEQTGFGEDDLVAVGNKAKKEVSRHALSVREIETVPGTNGDALKAIQNLPGVARTDGEALILRGGGDTQVFVNGMPLPAAFHFFGLRSTVGSGLLETVEVVPGNYAARYGRANGGIVDVGLRRPKDDGLHGFAQIDLFDASAMVEGPVGDNGAFAIGARRSYIDAVLPLLLDEEGKRMFPVAPRYYDFQAVYDWNSGGKRLRAAVLGSSDRMELMFDEPVEDDPDLRGAVSYGQTWVSPQVLWDHRIDERTSHSAGVSYLTGSFDQTIGSDLKLQFTPHIVQVRDEWSYQVTDWLTARAGIDAQVKHYEFDVAVPLPPKEGQVPTPLSTSPIYRAEDSVTKTLPAAWLALEAQAGALLMIPSFRVDHYSYANQVSGTLVVQPRFHARFAATQTTTLKGGVGFYSEAPDIDETNDVFGNPAAEPDLSIQYSLGAEQRLSDAVTLDVTGFYKRLYNMLTPVDDPAVKYDNTGLGRAYGGEFLLRHESRSRLYGWLAYTLMRSERRDAGASDYRLFDTDQTHNLTAVAQYRLSPTWEVGARFRYVTGSPTTEVVGATYDSDADIYVPTYGEHNASRLQAFHQLDVRVDKHFIFDAWRLTAYLDVQNAYNASNAGGVNYNYDYSQSRPATGLPLIPSFGVKGEF